MWYNKPKGEQGKARQDRKMAYYWVYLLLSGLEEGQQKLACQGIQAVTWQEEAKPQIHLQGITPSDQQATRGMSQMGSTC